MLNTIKKWTPQKQLQDSRFRNTPYQLINKLHHSQDDHIHFTVHKPSRHKKWYKETKQVTLQMVIVAPLICILMFLNVVKHMIYWSNFWKSISINVIFFYEYFLFVQYSTYAFETVSKRPWNGIPQEITQCKLMRAGQQIIMK